MDPASVVNAQIYELLWRSSGPDSRISLSICDAVLFRNKCVCATPTLSYTLSIC